jgi:N-acetylglucosaminyldiphosphoundecaprenol N-acetyl-beta-D-mannosaminyltransferase
MSLAERRLFLLGGEDGTAALAAERLVQRYPHLHIAGTYEPPRAALANMDHEEILHRIAATRPDVLLVALGHPKQDLWIANHRDRLNVSVAVGVGCTFDLIAGRRHRAPSLMQRLGLEWLYRLFREPRRLGRRYVIDAWVLATVLFPGALRCRWLKEADSPGSPDHREWRMS